MYFKAAINRINNIDWERMGTNQQKDEEWHMGEYLKRLETLIEEYGLGQIHIHLDRVVGKRVVILLCRLWSRGV